MNTPSTHSQALALITSSALSNLTPDDALLIPELKRLGIQTFPQVWDQPWDTSHGPVRTALIRSPWDYYVKHAQFTNWIRHTQHSGITLFNPPELLIWNSDKLYLKTLAELGIPILPTRYLTFKSHASLQSELEAAFQEFKSPAIVIKPRISGAGHHTFKLEPQEVGRELPYLLDTPLLIQPFAPEIQTQGELSVISFNQEFSHAVVKLPAPAGFLVQEKNGGSYHAVTAPTEARDLAHKLFKVVDDLLHTGTLLYSRVDLIHIPTRGWVLMELEVLEPSLFLDASPTAPATYARAIASRIKPFL